MKEAPTIGFGYRPSYTLFIAALVITVLAGWAISISGAPRWLRLALDLLVVLWIVASGSRLRPRIRRVTWHADGVTELTLRDTPLAAGRTVQGAVSASRVIGPLIVLTVRWPPREREHLWLLPDNLDADTRRRLRVRLASGNPLTSGNADSP